MTHGEILSIRARSADQCGRGAHERIRLSSPSGRGTRRSVSDLATPSLPLCGTGTGGGRFGCRSGAETCLYGEAAPKPYRGHSAARRFCRPASRRDGLAGSLGFSRRGRGAWLARRPVAEPSNWNTSSTVCRLCESRKRTVCSFLTGFGVALPATPSSSAKEDSMKKVAVCARTAVAGHGDFLPDPPETGVPGQPLPAGSLA